ncbi:hypothetical protein N7493_011618 [Penicillium malachiteum]|uniref:DUF7053 domain-containing protein n=1 Tax=Penicillium malachiteum TaxID=1324776 RepID=A0AAD6HB79_9EURO|nr:hypothetical protein N7493_011618 [Penicillium malachiteum]
MMQRKELYTNVTLLPSSIPRQLALDILHSHSEIITLSPLVLSHHPIKAPRHATADEYYSSWYEIIQRVQYVPGIGKMGSGKISFKGCFENVPWGLKTHTYPPMGIDLKSKWRVAGNEPHEEPDITETRPSGAPQNGLYLLEEVEIKCNMTLMSFVKNQLKAASKVLVERLIKKAELLDAGVLQAMFQDGKLRTFNPADRTSTSPFQLQTHFSQASAGLPQSPTGMSRWGSMSSSSSGPRAAHSYYQGRRKSGVVELPDTSPSPQELPVKQPDKGVPSELPVMEEVSRGCR